MYFIKCEERLGAMRKTNVFLEIDDSVYEAVVEPHKRSKTFSKLIAALLNGYIKDEYVRAYGDNMIDDLRKASVDSLDDVLGSMHDSLANMGLFTDELQMVNTKGSNFFSKKKEEFSQENIEKEEEHVKSESSREVKELQEEMGALEGKLSSVMEQNAQILELLKGNILAGVQASAEMAISSGETEESKEVNCDNVEEDEEDSLEFMENELSDSIEEPEEDAENGNNYDNSIEEEENIPAFDMSFLSDAAISF